ncbi:MAG: maleylpyruvate isomerase family mycothiol-dependent enzyme [Actinomycetota bacterium]
MSQNLRNFVQALYAFDAIVARTEGAAWQADTPCDGWDATALVEHQCAVMNGVQQVAASGAMAAPTPPEDMSDPQATWIDTRDRLMETLDGQGVLAQEGPFWFQAPTVDDLIGIVMWDLVTHTWDLAQASDQAHGLDDALVQSAYDVVLPMSEMLVGSKRTAESIPVAADAPIMERYLGLVGRQA